MTGCGRSSVPPVGAPAMRVMRLDALPGKEGDFLEKEQTCPAGVLTSSPEWWSCCRERILSWGLKLFFLTVHGRATYGDHWAWWTSQICCRFWALHTRTHTHSAGGAILGHDSNVCLKGIFDWCLWIILMYSRYSVYGCVWHIYPRYVTIHSL